MFQSNAISGIDTDEKKLLSEVTGAASAAVPEFKAADSDFTVTGTTKVDGVILDVSAKGKIKVGVNQTLTLVRSRVTSGGIYTDTLTASAHKGVKANASIVSTSDTTINSVTKLAEAALVVAENAVTVETAGSGKLGAVGALGDGAVGASSTVEIDTGDTFTVTGTTIAVGH
jgi:hypothetical protein